MACGVVGACKGVVGPGAGGSAPLTSGAPGTAGRGAEREVPHAGTTDMASASRMPTSVATRTGENVETDMWREGEDVIARYGGMTLGLWRVAVSCRHGLFWPRSEAGFLDPAVISYPRVNRDGLHCRDGGSPDAHFRFLAPILAPTLAPTSSPLPPPRG